MEREKALESILGVSPQTSNSRHPSHLGWLPKEVTEDDLAILRGFMDTIGRTIAGSTVQADEREDLVALDRID